MRGVVSQKPYGGAWQFQVGGWPYLCGTVECRQAAWEWHPLGHRGPGSFRWADGRIYVGQWNAGKQHGNGTLWDTEGLAVSGGRMAVFMWDSGMPASSMGMAPSGTPRAWQFQVGGWPYLCGTVECRQAAWEWHPLGHRGPGSFRWADGRIYVGQWNAGKQHGNGTLWD